MPLGTAGVNHFHEKARQFFYVLPGVAVLDANGVAAELHPGDGTEIALGVPLQTKNGGSGNVEFLVVSNPHSHGGRQVV
jgi:mannose-6-phosphate isomerase-like protein (cupin superfamily)